MSGIVHVACGGGVIGWRVLEKWYVGLVGWGECCGIVFFRENVCGRCVDGG